MTIGRDKINTSKNEVHDRLCNPKRDAIYIYMHATLNELNKLDFESDMHVLHVYMKM